VASTVSSIRLSLDNAVNLRDVGGLPCRDGGSTRHLALLRSGSLRLLSPADARVLMSVCGVAVVVDLRTARELAADGPSVLARAGVAGVHLPLAREDRPPLPETAADDPVGALHRAYREYLDERGHHLVTLARVIAASGGATLVHCAAGKDRTGVVCALALAVAGVEPEAIIADYAQTAEVIDALVAKLAASPTYAEDMTSRDVASHTPRAESMRRVLDLLEERWGGPIGWLEANGFGADEQAALRARLRD
jgi:protein tyrosine/serine phosphatase